MLAASSRVLNVRWSGDLTCGIMPHFVQIAKNRIFCSLGRIVYLVLRGKVSVTGCILQSYLTKIYISQIHSPNLYLTQCYACFRE